MKFPFDIRWSIVGLLGCSMAVNVVFLIEKLSGNAAVSAEQTHTVVEAPLEQVEPVQEPMTLGEDWKVLQLRVTRSLSQTFTKAAPSHGSALSAVYSRLFMFDINMRRDLQKGDLVEVVYKIGDDGIPDIAAARFHSKKKKKTFSAYRWQAPFDSYRSYWSSDGTETAYRLKKFSHQRIRANYVTAQRSSQSQRNGFQSTSGRANGLAKIRCGHTGQLWFVCIQRWMCGSKVF